MSKILHRVDLFSALFSMSFGLLIRNSQCVEGAKEVIIKIVPHFIRGLFTIFNIIFKNFHRAMEYDAF